MENTLVINYESALKNHVRADCQKAVQLFLAGDVGTAIMIFPQALNPTLKALENLRVWNQVMVLPEKDENNKPIYIMVKIGKFSVKSVVVESKE